MNVDRRDSLEERETVATVYAIAKDTTADLGPFAFELSCDFPKSGTRA